MKIAAITLVSLVGLSGCVTPTGPTTSAASNTQISRFSQETGDRLKKTIEAKGWLYVGNSTNNTTRIESMHFVQPNSIARFGSAARVRALVTHATPVTGGNVSSSIVSSQYDCNARTLQVLNGEGFSDQTATVRIGGFNDAGRILPVTANTIGDVIMVGACTGRFASTSAGVAPQRRGGSGSGIVIAPQMVLTNQHVVANCGALDVMMNGNRHPAKLRKQDANNDLALLDVATLPVGPTPALRRQAATGEPVLVAGYPLSGVLSSDIIVTDGIVNSLSGLANNASQLQISAPVQPGNSGGPLIDRGGNLVGVVVAKLNALRAAAITGDIPQNINFAIKPEIVSLFVQSENLAMRSTESKAKLDTQALAELARGFTLKVECKP
jgi:S1-C subfamily serine protease